MTGDAVALKYVSPLFNDLQFEPVTKSQPKLSIISPASLRHTSSAYINVGL